MILFIFNNNTNIKFAEKKLTWKTYIAKKALLTTRQVEIINKKKFAKNILNENIKAYIVYIPSLTLMIILLLEKSHIVMLLI